ncbi:MAG TPA: polyprenyl synthetase family protein [Microbacteriaceae bacterium]|nr:polyprenyl synthetase family protein [Microbacteriaceae bacterium]
MHEALSAPALITERINYFLKQKSLELTDLGDDISPLLDETKAFLQGGKRLRGQFLITGFESVAPISLSDKQNQTTQALLLAASALEVFHAAALIHDDIIDKSNMRRGRPTVHEIFRTFHRENDYSGEADHFGLSAALLAGDVLQSWADELMNDGLELLSSRQHARSARKIFNTMRSEVAMGQHLDVIEEVRNSFAEHQLQLERSTKVLIYKSAKYSVQAPLLLGGAMAGANEAESAALADFGLPIGVAFQLRDDLLGVFGEEEITGKPSGDDLREGKRTVLVTLAREELPPGPKRVFDDMHGTSDLDEDQIKTLQHTIEDTGAKQRVEQMIQQNVGLARQALHDSNLQQHAITELLKLADLATARES